MSDVSELSRVCANCGARVLREQPCPACALFLIMEPEVAAGPHFDPSALPSGFGPYQMRREIAVGGMGVVYEAYDPRLGRVIAVKLMRSLLLATADEKARFRTEAGAAAQLDHPNIVPVHEVGEQDGQPYFTMKLIEDGSLAERLKRGPLPFREAAVFEKAYLILLLQEMIEAGVKVAHADTPGGYMEVDTQEDFELAQRDWRGK